MLAFIRRNFRWIAGGIMLTYLSSFGQTYFISASVSEWQAAFGLSHGEFGRLYMFATLASAVCLPFAGRLLDLIPPHRIIALVVPVLAGAALLAGYASSVPVLAVAIFALRLFGQGMMTHIALTTTGDGLLPSGGGQYRLSYSATREPRPRSRWRSRRLRSHTDIVWAGLPPLSCCLPSVCPLLIGATASRECRTGNRRPRHRRILRCATGHGGKFCGIRFTGYC